eukprot:SAG11_NODE_3335_length_2519_cov_1.665289_3_plen_241_part_00
MAIRREGRRTAARADGAVLRALSLRSEQLKLWCARLFPVPLHCASSLCLFPVPLHCAEIKCSRSKPRCPLTCSGLLSRCVWCIVRRQRVVRWHWAVRLTASRATAVICVTSSRATAGQIARNSVRALRFLRTCRVLCACTSSNCSPFKIPANTLCSSPSCSCRAPPAGMGSTPSRPEHCEAERYRLRALSFQLQRTQLRVGGTDGDGAEWRALSLSGFNPGRLEVMARACRLLLSMFYVC